MTRTHHEMPAPLVSPFRHPIRWVEITVLSLVAVVVLAHIANLDVSGLYWVVLQWNTHVKHWWDHLITNQNLRHSIRDVAEGFYAGAIAQQLVWNSFRKRRIKYEAKPMNRLDRIEDALRIPNLRSKRELSFWQIPYALLLWAPLYGSVGFVAAYFLDSAIKGNITLLQHIASAAAPHASYWQRVASIDTSSWDKKVMGFAASLFFGRRPLRKVFDGVQLWFAERHVASGKPMHWFYPPTFRARCRDVATKVQEGLIIATDRHGTLQTVLMVAVLVIVVVLAGFGYYVLTVIALHK